MLYLIEKWDSIFSLYNIKMLRFRLRKLKLPQTLFYGTCCPWIPFNFIIATIMWLLFHANHVISYFLIWRFYYAAVIKYDHRKSNSFPFSCF